MSSDPIAVLVVPVDGDIGGLLAVGRCGARAPCCTRLRSFGDEPERWAAGRMVGYPGEIVALPLWWDGALVPEGWDRARRVLDARGDAWVGRYLFAPTLSNVIIGAQAFVYNGLAARVVLLDLVDGRLVERAP